MEEGRKFGDPSGFMVKKRSSSGCLIVRKKVNNDINEDIRVGIGVGSSSSRNLFGLKDERKRDGLKLSDSESSDDLLVPSRKRIGPETMRVGNGLNLFGSTNVEGDVDRKMSGSDDVNGREGDFGGGKRNKVDVFRFNDSEGNREKMMGHMRRDFGDDDDYDDDDNATGEIEGRRRFASSMMTERSAAETGLSRHPFVDRSKSSYFKKPTGVNGGCHGNRNGSRNRARPMSFYGDQCDSKELIRVQGKNGVLKVMVNKKRVGGLLKSYDSLEGEEKSHCSRAEGTAKRDATIHPPLLYSDSRRFEKASSVVGTLRSPMNILRPASTKTSSARIGKDGYHDSENSGTSLQLGPIKLDSRNCMKTPLSSNNHKGHDVDSEDSDTLLKLGLNKEKARKSVKHANSDAEITPSNQPLTRNREGKGKVKRGSGTEKQKLRERIRETLLNAGWTIDYRPRRNRDYLDAVYRNPNGTAYWSIIKAYEALLKQLNNEEETEKSRAAPLSDEVLSQLTRKTKKKMERELKMKEKMQRDANACEFAREMTARKSSSSERIEKSTNSGSHGEKQSFFIKKCHKPFNGRELVNKFGESNSDSTSLNKTEMDSLVKDEYESYNKGDIQGVRALNLNRSASDEIASPVSTEEAKSVDYQLEDKFAEVASKSKDRFQL